jgi:hypothetical protein
MASISEVITLYGHCSENLIKPWKSTAAYLYATYFVGMEKPDLDIKPVQMHSVHFCDHLTEQ